MRHALLGWRLVGWMLAWLAGVALQLQERTLLPGWAYALACAGAAVAIGVALRARTGSTLLLAFACAVLGFGATGWHAQLRLAEALPPALEGVDLQVTGIVASLPQRGPSGQAISPGGYEQSGTYVVPFFQATDR